MDSRALLRIGTGAVPGHSNKEGAIVAVIGGPPVLRIRHQREKVLLDRIQIQLLECLAIVEIVVIALLFWQNSQVQAVGPPVLIGRAACCSLPFMAAKDRTFLCAVGVIFPNFAGHRCFLLVSVENERLVARRSLERF